MSDHNGNDDDEFIDDVLDVECNVDNEDDDQDDVNVPYGINDDYDDENVDVHDDGACHNTYGY